MSRDSCPSGTNQGLAENLVSNGRKRSLEQPFGCLSTENQIGGFKFWAETPLQRSLNRFEDAQAPLVLMGVDSLKSAAIQFYICSRPSGSLVLNQSALNCEVKAGGLALQLQIGRVFCAATKLAVDAL